MHIAKTPVTADGVYVIAEAGVNHNGDLDTARDLVDAAADAGADAVKFQTFSADRLVTRDSPKAEYQERTTDGDSQYEMLRALELSAAEHRELRRHCEARGITFLSSVFDPESANLLDDLDVAAIKIGSGELTNQPLLEHVAGLGRPLVVSTGMATMAEVDAAVATIRGVDADVPFALLHCTSVYPADVADVNLRAMQRMAERFDVPVGYSDHTTAVETPAFATAAGALVLEKHFTLDATMDGPDHAASLEPEALERTVSLARRAAVARGSPEKRPVPAEEDTRYTSRKSLHATANVRAGQTFTADSVGVLRPAEGLPPSAFRDVIGREAAVDLEEGAAITADAVRDFESTAEGR